ncbi:hypothetical protein PENSTE_c004G08729 [Penicillium steckii]|uniref:Plastocyanin-like domain-containing protein n=1 Tax=Penicillium steckii TaxID=303698 RepID=A0A1V6TQA4_9EURO|nr:hypothetical protein PENSTE_c004G08729 [Penicillium steckii]
MNDLLRQAESWQGLSNMTYEWLATQYGTAWYHAHVHSTAWEGVFGRIIINGPASQNYDEDLGKLLISDWTHYTAQETYPVVEQNGPQGIANGLLNGKNIWYDGQNKGACPLNGSIPAGGCFFKRDPTPLPDMVGERYKAIVERGKSYRIRLVNTALNDNCEFLVEGHSITVIAIDLVPIKPYVPATNSVKIYMANATGDGPFWINATVLTGCSWIHNIGTIQGILYYGNDTDEIPVNQELPGSVPRDNSCFDEPLGHVFHNCSAQINQNFYEIPEGQEWAYMLINNTVTGKASVEHHIHLHDHDFYILAQGMGQLEQSMINLENPARRDTALLLGHAGYLLIAWKANSPGLWLMHCHLAFHSAMVFDLQILERREEFNRTANLTECNRVCYELASPPGAWDHWNQRQSEAFAGV